MDGETIKSFLVGLGFGVDDASLAKFSKAIAVATLKVNVLYDAVKVTAKAIYSSISSISDSFEQLGYEYKILAPAINKALILRQEMLKAYKATGMSFTRVVQSAARLNLSLTKTKYAFEALYKSVAARFFDIVTKKSDQFRKTLYDNMPRIQDILERTVKFIFQMMDALAALGGRLWSILTRVYDLFVKLDHATDGWSTAILGALAAWKLLNLGFFLTPFGMLIAGFTTLLALWDDFKTFKEGGQSLINWGSSTTKMMVGLTTAILGVAGAIAAVILGMKAWAVLGPIIGAATTLALGPIGLMIAAVAALVAVLALVITKWDAVKQGLSSFFMGIGSKVLDFLSGDNVAANVGANSSGQPPKASPIGSSVQNSNSNQVNQQTQINIAGVADANAAGKAAASEQGKVNFDLVRNLKGATTP